MKSGVVLSVKDHSRDTAGFTYVYPVVSRRAGGVSVGINLNPNNACNWRCVYCQVPNLVRGAAPDLDLAQLEAELAAQLEDIVSGDFMPQHVPEGMRRLNDIALSGNGEPTTSHQFADVIEIIARQMARFELIGKIKLVLITNGSQTYRPAVQAALKRMARLGGEVWFKIDRGDASSIERVNQVKLEPEALARHARMAVECCPTWIQTCMFEWDGQAPNETELAAYLSLIDSIKGLQGVLLYTVAREPMLEEGGRVSALSGPWLEALAERIRALAIPVKVSV
jgi:wyosine [tRNA(Phe)-imidazoG37] synthetase (radical SAM superfamily)